MLSPMLRIKGLLAATLLMTGSTAMAAKAIKSNAEFWRAMEPKKTANLRDNKLKRQARFYKNLMAKAKLSDTTPRKLDQEDDDFGFDVTQYSLKYTGCASVETYSDELADDRDGLTVLATKRFAMFRMCPTEYCNKYSTDGCDSDYGEYMIEVEEYLRAINEFNEERMEEICGYCAYCMQTVEANQAKNNAYDDGAQDEYGDVEAQGYGDDGGYRERKLDEAAEDEQYADNAYADNADADDGDQTYEDLGCAYYEECQDYYDECVSWYQQKAMEFDDFFECIAVDAEDDGGDEYYLAPHCASDGYTITIGVFSDEYCSTYVGDSVTVEEVTGMQFSEGENLAYFPKQCVSCSGNEEDQFWAGYGEENDNDNDNNNNNNDEEEVLEICRELYEESAKCHKNLYTDDYSAYGGYASANQQANEDVVCDYISSLMNGNYNENGEVIVDSSLHFPSFNVSDWKNGQQYMDELNYAKDVAKKVDNGLIAGLVITIFACLVMWIWACCLHSQLASKNIPWRPRRGKYTDPTAISRQNSGIVMGRSRSGTTPLI